jgi:hypothetical protein
MRNERKQGNKGIDTMSRKTKNALPPAAEPDWREAAEARGRAAFEAAVAEPEQNPKPLSWLMGTDEETSR